MQKWEYLYIYPNSGDLTVPEQLHIWPTEIVDLSWATDEYQAKVENAWGVTAVWIPEDRRVEFGQAMFRFLGQSGWEAFVHQKWTMWFKRPIEN